jgi:predicted nucleic acid-binding protein
MHSRARKNFDSFAQQKAELFTSSFVLVEITSLLQRRVGLESVRDFNLRILPLIEIIWTDKEWYARAVQRLLLLGQKNTSLVDCLSFEIMESYDISLAFTFDRHFQEMGFTIADTK